MENSVALAARVNQIPNYSSRPCVLAGADKNNSQRQIKDAGVAIIS